VTNMPKFHFDIMSIISGKKAHFELERRIFCIVCFFGALAGFFSLISTIAIWQNWLVPVLSILYTAFMSVLYYFSRFKNLYKPFIWPLFIISCLMLSMTWISNSGPAGSAVFVYFVAALFFTILAKGKSKYIMVILIIINIIILQLINLYHPEWSTPYSGNFDRILDYVITFGYSALLIMTGASVVFKGYTEERQLVEEEKNKLKKRNDTIERELMMAREIQLRAIPSASPYPEISFYYKSMEEVGGDYFDFVKFRNRNKIGVFISDVSGHGMPAAMITSMIKTILLENRDLSGDPAKLLDHLNAVLFMNSNNYYITAFYGIYDMKKRQLIYANAGHNLPFLIQKDRILQLENKGRGIPLAVMTHDEMKDMSRFYQNTAVKLKVHTKILFYTDGLTEAVSASKTGVDFETDLLRDLLIKWNSLPSKKLMDRLSKTLLKYHGSDQFYDDVCAICLDIK
jgi:serine phosphatase RsbU (regulator of sigma subunit)